MGSFNMNASFSKMPILNDTTVIICLKRKINNVVRLIPLTYPIEGKYWDYGIVHDFKENEITKAICDFFEFDNMNDVIEFIYNMTIHGDYEDGLKRIKNGQVPYEKDKFDKYQAILNKLRNNSGIIVKTEDEIINDNIKLIERLKKDKKVSQHALDSITNINMNYDIEYNNKLKDMLDSYELALFYENTPVFNALCSEDSVDDTGKPMDSYSVSNSYITVQWTYEEDKNNIFYITNSCNSKETNEIKKRFARLLHNFNMESKTFILEETTILGQEYCSYMWYKYGKSIHKLWKNYINNYSNFDIDKISET